MWDMLNLPQGQRPVEVRTVRGSPSGEISQMDAQPILPPEREGPLTLVPDSLIIADDYVHSSSRSTHCLSCRNPTMPGLPYCEYCGNAKVKELPETIRARWKPSHSLTCLVGCGGSRRFLKLRVLGAACLLLRCVLQEGN